MACARALRHYIIGAFRPGPWHGTGVSLPLPALIPHFSATKRHTPRAYPSSRGRRYKRCCGGRVARVIRHMCSMGHWGFNFGQQPALASAPLRRWLLCVCPQNYPGSGGKAHLLRQCPPPLARPFGPREADAITRVSTLPKHASAFPCANVYARIRVHCNRSRLQRLGGWSGFTGANSARISIWGYALTGSGASPRQHAVAVSPEV